jgi:hypothetical protein
VDARSSQPPPGEGLGLILDWQGAAECLEHIERDDQVDGLLAQVIGRLSLAGERIESLRAQPSLELLCRPCLCVIVVLYRSRREGGRVRPAEESRRADILGYGWSGPVELDESCERCCC